MKKHVNEPMELTTKPEDAEPLRSERYGSVVFVVEEKSRDDVLVLRQGCTTGSNC